MKLGALATAAGLTLVAATLTTAPSFSVEATTSDPPSTVVIDNTESELTPAESWRTSTSLPGYFGDNYAFAQPGEADPVARWRPGTLAPGTYAIDVWLPNGNHERSADVGYRVHHAGQVTTFSLNQQVEGGYWAPGAAELAFAGDGNEFVELVVNDADGWPIVVPTHFVRDGGELLVHLARPNPVWAAIDAAYDAPPTTSAEVLWGEPVEPASTASVGAPAGFEELTNTTFGAAQLLWLLEAPGGEPEAALDDADGRARAWAGGEVTVWGRGDDSAVGVALVDGGQGSAPLCDTVSEWFDASYADGEVADDGSPTSFDGGSSAAGLRCDGDDVVLAIAADEAAVTEILG
jgi:hypothetical protein